MFGGLAQMFGGGGMAGKATDVVQDYMKTITAPKQAEVSTNPDDYKGYDSSGIRKAMEQNLARRAAQSRAQALASLGKAGIKGADTSRAITDIASEQEQARQDVNAKWDWQDYQSRLAERDFALRKAESDFAKQMGLWNRQWDAWDADKAKREKEASDMLNAAAMFGGNYFGGR